jgi:hypothetical protein
MARRLIWPRAKHRVGLERPHLCPPYRGQGAAWGRSSPQRNFLQYLTACFAGYQAKQVKQVRNTLCTFKLAASSPEVRPTEFVLKDLQGPPPRKLPCKIAQIGRERPHFFVEDPPKGFVGSLPPSQTICVDDLRGLLVRIREFVRQNV